MIDFSDLYQDLLDNKPIENEAEDVENQNLVDDDGFMKVIKNKRQKKLLY
jgi:hypothetical protein